MTPFPVAILAGGMGSRLGPLTADRPKALVEVAGQPFIVHQLRLLARAGIERVVVCSGYRGEQIESAIGNGASFGLQVEHVTDGRELLGTAGALRQALPRLGEDFFVLYGDSYLDCDYQAVQAAYEATDCLGLMGVTTPPARRYHANVMLRPDGRIAVYRKGGGFPDMRHIDYGLSVLDRRAFALVPPTGPADLADLFVSLADCQELAAYAVAERFYEMGSPLGLAETRAQVRMAAVR